MKYIKCPGCGSEVVLERPGVINVNIETKQMVHIPNLWSVTLPCRNPACEWSKVRGTYI